MKVYVGNLPWAIDDKALKELFAEFGEIEDSVLIKDKFSNRSKGFGFITFTNDEDANKAISEMHEKEVEGRPLTVSEARPMVKRDNSSREDSPKEESSEAPMANPSEINNQVEEDVGQDIETEEPIKKAA